MKFEKLTEGMTLYDVHSYRMGNTLMRSLGVWPVKVISVDREKRTAVCSWNGNRPTTYFERDIAALKVEEPILVRNSLGQARRPTREERTAILAERKAAARNQTNTKD